METHHSHHVTHKKKWTEYLLEFFMLFLAVFLGFIAENIRENVVEGHREKQFMSAMARDLQLDTIQFAAIRRYNANKLRLTDSVIIFFSSHIDDRVPASNYYHAFELIKGGSFFQNSGTIDQLKNSGGLRLIKKRVVVDSIQGYDQAMRRLILRDRIEVDESVKNIDLLQRLFDGQSLTALYVDSVFYKKPADVSNTLIPLNSAYRGEYLNHLREYRFLIFEDMKLRDQIAAKATNLLILIQKQYHLE
ncbi:MAG TPA: hypothetical protein VMY77_05360 [Chitinophagaceae bacterium]|nr:hypothetical protein [Chitinophagaceae bacterium]